GRVGLSLGSDGAGIPVTALIDPVLDGSNLPVREFTAAQRHCWFIQTCDHAVEPAILGLSRNNGGPARATPQRAFESAQVEPGTLHRRAVTAQTVLLQYRLDVFAEGDRR